MMDASQLDFHPNKWIEDILTQTQQKLKEAQLMGRKLAEQIRLYEYLIEQIKNLPQHHLDALKEEIKVFSAKKESLKQSIEENEKLQVQLSTKLNALRVLGDKMNI